MWEGDRGAENGPWALPALYSERNVNEQRRGVLARCPVPDLCGCLAPLPTQGPAVGDPLPTQRGQINQGPSP